jgi:hypothetical protein
MVWRLDSELGETNEIYLLSLVERPVNVIL